MKLQLTCDTCTRVQVIASGYCADPILWPTERIINAAAKIGWHVGTDATECPECAGNPEPIKLTLSDLHLD